MDVKIMYANDPRAILTTSSQYFVYCHYETVSGITGGLGFTHKITRLIPVMTNRPALGFTKDAAVRHIKRVFGSGVDVNITDMVEVPPIVSRLLYLGLRPSYA